MKENGASSVDGIDAWREGWKPVSQQWQMLLQLGVAYTCAIMWFKDALYETWTGINAENYFYLGDWLTQRGIVPAPASMTDGERHLGVLAASGWHVLLTVFGFVLGNTLKRLPTGQGVALGQTFVAMTAIVLYTLTKHGYDNELWGIPHVARTLRWPAEIEGSSHYLALLASITQVLWLSAAMAMASCDQREVGYCPKIVALYLDRIVAFYIMTFAFFRFGCIPVWDFLVKHSLMAPEKTAEVRQDISLSNLAYLSSGTHTLTIILGIVCARIALALMGLISNRFFASNTWQTAVVVLLCASFSYIFSLWVQYALARPVDHVVHFAAAFLGENAVKEAGKQSWSPVHTVTMSSYTVWFACGVVFEQCWGGSATNRIEPTRKGPRGAGGLSAALLAFIVSVVVLPTAWLAGYFGILILAVLLWPQPSTPNPRQPSAEPDAFKKVSWEKATADCPKTGESYMVIGVGFVGISLVKRLLQRGETKVKAFDISPRNPFEGDSRVEYIRGDVTNMKDLEKALQGIDTVYATFAMIRFFERLKFQAALSVKVNIDGTKNVIAACRKAGVKRLIQTSTSNVMACPKLAKFDMTEKSPYVTRDVSHNHYSWTKAKAEQLILEANDDKFQTVAIRPCSGVFGANDRTLVERFLRHKVLVMPVPKAKIDYVFCENVVLGHLKAEARLREGRQGVAGEAFNISNHEPCTFEELGITIQRYYGPGLYRVPAPKILLKIICHFVEAVKWMSTNKISLGQDLDITTPACYQTAAMCFSVNNEKSTKFLDYKPCWNLDEAIQQSLADFAEQNPA